MAKTPIKEWEPIGIAAGRRYKREDFEAILEVTKLDLSWRDMLRLRHGIEPPVCGVRPGAIYRTRKACTLMFDSR